MTKSAPASADGCEGSLYCRKNFSERAKLFPRDKALAIGTANARATKLAVDAYGGPEYRLADALTKISQPLVPQFLMSGAQGQETSTGLIPTAMLSSMFGRMMPDALEKLKEEAPKSARRDNRP
jgi:hypothetical protein